MDDRLLWYVTRGSGAVALILLSGVVVMGVLARLRMQGRAWPRFLTVTLHRDLSLVAVVFLLLHIVTAAVDPFTHLGLTAVAVPFGSTYRTFWLGLGTIAFELMVAIGLTSLARRWIGHRTWRAVHWAAYALWPMAVLHSLGTGTDAFAGWMLVITGVCIAAVAVAVLWRLAAGRSPLQTERRRRLDLAARAQR